MLSTGSRPRGVFHTYHDYFARSCLFDAHVRRSWGKVRAVGHGAAAHAGGNGAIAGGAGALRMRAGFWAGTHKTLVVKYTTSIYS